MMSSQMVLDIAYLVLLTCAKIAGPFLLAAVITGVLVNIFQTVTSIKDMSLTFIPKVVVASIVACLALPYSIEVMKSLFTQVFQMIASIGA